MGKWTLEHWLLLALFVAGSLFETLAKAESWGAVMALMTPGVVFGLALQALAFLRTMYVNKPREPFGDRRGD
jgi:hypothetical protein